MEPGFCIPSKNGRSLILIDWFHYVLPGEVKPLNHTPRYRERFVYQDKDSVYSHEFIWSLN